MGAHRFQWRWRLKDLETVEKHGKTVFSCFACGGGSSMGYKLAGYTVLGNCEIDPRMAAVYHSNLHPVHEYVMDIRDFNKIDNAKLPQELFSLDVLDGSPPCSVFSMAGDREKGWGKEKLFREGQAMQRLDDLFFYFIETAEKLRPKIVIAENVEGLVKGNAKLYCKEIVKRFNAAGYIPHVFLLHGETIGVPQKRTRVFFLARRKDLGDAIINLQVQEPPVKFKEIRSEHGKPWATDGVCKWLAERRRNGDKDLADIGKRLRGKESNFNTRIVYDNDVSYTMVAGNRHVRMCDGLLMSDQDVIAAQTFPQDYDFGKEDPQYICGMSVPPVMMAHVASAVYEQWLA